MAHATVANVYPHRDSGWIALHVFIVAATAFLWWQTAWWFAIGLLPFLLFLENFRQFLSGRKRSLSERLRIGAARRSDGRPAIKWGNALRWMFCLLTLGLARIIDTVVDWPVVNISAGAAFGVVSHAIIWGGMTAIVFSKAFLTAFTEAGVIYFQRAQERHNGTKPSLREEGLNILPWTKIEHAEAWLWPPYHWNIGAKLTLRTRDGEMIELPLNWFRDSAYVLWYVSQRLPEDAQLGPYLKKFVTAAEVADRAAHA